MYTIKGEALDTTRACIVSRHSLRETALLCNYLCNLYGSFYVFEMFQDYWITLPVRCTAGDTFFYVGIDSKLKTRHADRGTFVAPWQCEASRRISDPTIIGQFWLGCFGPPSTFPILRRAISMYSAISSVISVTTTLKTTKTWKTAKGSWLLKQASSFCEEDIQNLV